MLRRTACSGAGRLAGLCLACRGHHTTSWRPLLPRCCGSSHQLWCQPRPPHPYGAGVVSSPCRLPCAALVLWQSSGRREAFGPNNKAPLPPAPNPGGYSHLLPSTCAQEAFRTSFQKSLLPAFEGACQSMFAQINGALAQGFQEHVQVAGWWAFCIDSVCV